MPTGVALMITSNCLLGNVGALEYFDLRLPGQLLPLFGGAIGDEDLSAFVFQAESRGSSHPAGADDQHPRFRQVSYAAPAAR